ncbi:hypothetical protein CDD83_110 [Cordyceps sp. RAO-2017]|nr:hypothetical protein CDD83_110 [Cordyceps sp. RAO-2017]
MADPSCTVTIVLATTIPSAVLLLLGAVLFWRLFRRKKRLFHRGITPIDDEEIASWKTARSDEKVAGPGPPSSIWRDSLPSSHRPSNSVVSSRKPASVIVYQNPSQHGLRLSEDMPTSPPHNKRSVDVPPTPVLARAPNARPGLTDEAIQGEDAFIAQARRHPCRLAKPPPPRVPRHNRSKSSRATMSGATGTRDLWYGQHFDYQRLPRRSADQILPMSAAFGADFSDVPSTRSTPVRATFDDDVAFPGGLSPRPLVRKSEIGRAIG